MYKPTYSYPDLAIASIYAFRGYVGAKIVDYEKGIQLINEFIDFFKFHHLYEDRVYITFQVLFLLTDQKFRIEFKDIIEFKEYKKEELEELNKIAVNLACKVKLW